MTDVRTVDQDRYRSRPMRCFLHCDPPNDLTARLVSEFDQWRRPKKRDSEQFRLRCHNALELLTLNLVAAGRHDKDLWVQTPMNPGWYADNRFNLPHFMTLDAIKLSRSFLEDHGYADLQQGKASPFPDLRKPAAAQATTKLLNLSAEYGLEIGHIRQSGRDDLIRLKAPKLKRWVGGEWQTYGGKRLPFHRTPDIESMEAHLIRINEALQATHIDMKLTKLQERLMMTQILRKQERFEQETGEFEAYLDRSQNTCFRVFNNGTFNDGGRFYGPWWQAVPKDFRTHIMINGRRTVEVDYSAMHPTILSQRLGIEASANFYDIGLAEKDVVKRTFNALLNAKGTSIKPIDEFDDAEVGMPWKQFLKLVKDHYTAFSSYFGSGEGLRLQRMDSDIAEAVMLRCIDAGQVVLPIHDSFLSQEAFRSKLEEIMETEFERLTGGRISLKAKALSDEERSRIALEVSTSPLEYDHYFRRNRQLR